MKINHTQWCLLSWLITAPKEILSVKCLRQRCIMHLLIYSFWPSVLWRCWLGGRKGIRPVKTEWWGAGMVICLERGADLHMAQLMSLPLTVSCFSKIQGPNLLNVLRQSYDYLTIMPKLRSTYDERLIYKTSYEERKAFLRYYSLAKL